jgi:hypothetical protein
VSATGPEFTEEEVAEILARATERQEAAESAALMRTGGTSLEALEEVAREVGIAPEHVRAAALEVGSRAPVERGGRFGVPDRVVVERTLPERVSVERWGRIVEMLRGEFGANGILSDFGEVREWVSTNVAGASSIRPVRVRIEPSGPGTRVTIEETTARLRVLPWALGATFTSLAVVFLVLNLVFGFVTPAVVLMLLFGATGAVLGIGGLKLAGTRAVAKGVELEGVADRLELIARTDEETT